MAWIINLLMVDCECGLSGTVFRKTVCAEVVDVLLNLDIATDRLDDGVHVLRLITFSELPAVMTMRWRVIDRVRVRRLTQSRIITGVAMIHDSSPLLIGM